MTSTSSTPEHIYISVSELLNYAARRKVEDGIHKYASADHFAAQTVQKIYRTDPDAFTSLYKECAERNNNHMGTGSFATSVGIYETESYAHFQGYGDRVRNALLKIFNYKANPDERVLVKVAEQLSADPVLEQEAHPHYANGDDLNKRHFLITVQGSMYDYMERNP